jgi:ketosteroid isomerase-like protein
MAERNIEIVRAMLDAFTRQDYEAALSAFALDVEGDFTHMPEGRLVHGPDELRRAVARWQLTWDELDTELEEIQSVGENVVIVVRQAGVGKLSKAPMEMRYAQVFTVRDGRIAAMKTYLDPKEAFSAAGADSRAPG